MTIAAKYTPDSYTIGEGLETSHEITFEFLSADHIRVTKIPIATGTPVDLTVDEDFTIDDTTITLTEEPAEGDIIIIWMETPFTQPVDLLNTGQLDLEVIEASLDLAAIERQVLLETLERTVRIPITSDEDPGGYLTLIQGYRDSAEADAAAAAASAVEAEAAASEAAGSVTVLIHESVAEVDQTEIDLEFDINTEYPNFSLYVDGLRIPNSDVTVTDANTLTVAAFSGGEIIQVLNSSSESLNDVTAAVESSEAAQAAAEAAQAVAEAVQVSVGESETNVEGLASWVSILATSAVNARDAAEGFRDEVLAAQPLAARVNFNGALVSMTSAIRDSYNVSSITDLGTGEYRVNFTTAFANTYYQWAGSARDEDTGKGRFIVSAALGDTKTTSAIDIYVVRANDAAQRDSSEVNFVAWGD